ncbi:MAG: hypothetical protein ACI8S6_001196 [Myxococcota bacterium]
MLVLVVLLAVGMGSLVLLAPHHVAYRLTVDTLIVEAPLGPWDQGRRFDRSAVRSARSVTLTGGARHAGTGLPDFCLGRWGQQGIGEVWQATTCGPDAVLLDIEGDALLVRTVWGVRRVSLAGAAVRAAPGVRLGWRLFGLGMPGQQLGWYRVGGRTVLVYLTNADCAVWVESAEGRALLLSPQDVGGFIAAVLA